MSSASLRKRTSGCGREGVGHSTEWCACVRLMCGARMTRHGGHYAEQRWQCHDCLAVTGDCSRSARGSAVARVGLRGTRGSADTPTAEPVLTRALTRPADSAACRCAAQFSRPPYSRKRRASGSCLGGNAPNKETLRRTYWGGLWRRLALPFRPSMRLCECHGPGHRLAPYRFARTWGRPYGTAQESTEGRRAVAGAHRLD